MNGDLPDIYWYIFFAAAIILTIAAVSFGGMLEHRRRMRALDILKMYADKGTEPPAVIAEGLAEQILKPDNSPSLNQQRRGPLIQGFVSMVFSACATGGVAWWLLESEGPRWAFIVASCSTLFFGIAATGMLLAALVTFARGK